MVIGRLPLLLHWLFVPALLAAMRPATPVLIEPERDGQVVSAVDVHMVTAAFADEDAHKHLCTDWQIRTGEVVVWEASCATGAEKIHIDLGDGVFVGSRPGRRELVDGLSYRVIARHRDDSGDPATEWSGWGEREFQTSVRPPSPPLSIRDVLGSPASRSTAARITPSWARVRPASRPFSAARRCHGARANAASSSNAPLAVCSCR